MTKRHGETFMKYKKKKKDRNPPLSVLDKSIYTAAICLSGLLGFLLCWIYLFHLRTPLAFSRPDVIAVHMHASMLLCLPFIMFFPVSGIAFFADKLTEKKPIFGNPKIQYGQSPWAKDCFPLFSRRKKEKLTPRKKEFRKNMLRVGWFFLTAGLVLTLAIASLSLFGNDYLRNDNSVVCYNVFNRQSGKTYYNKDFYRLTLSTSSSRHRSWNYFMSIEMNDGKVFSFADNDFGKREDPLKKMLEIRNFFPLDNVTVSGAENVDKIADERKMNDEQRQLLHDLFGS